MLENLKSIFPTPIFMPENNITGLCLVADKYSKWAIANVLNNRVTAYMTKLTQKAFEGNRGDEYTYPHGAIKYDGYTAGFRYGTINGIACNRRDWTVTCSAGIWDRLDYLKDELGFDFSRWTECDLDRLSLKCVEDEKGLICEGLRGPNGAALEFYKANETAISLTETFKLGNKFIEETSSHPKQVSLLHNYLDPGYHIKDLILKANPPGTPIIDKTVLAVNNLTDNNITDLPGKEVLKQSAPSLNLSETLNQQEVLHKYLVLAGAGLVGMGCVYKACNEFEKFVDTLLDDRCTLSDKVYRAAMTGFWAAGAVVTVSAAVTLQRNMPGTNIV